MMQKKKRKISKSKKSNLVINPEDLDGRRLDFLSKNLTNRDPDLFITESTDNINHIQDHVHQM